MTVLVLTQRLDPTADLVVKELTNRDVAVVRCDTAEFPQQLALAASFDAGRWEGHLRTKHREVALTDVSAVYYRRPSGFEFPEFMSQVERRWAEKEARLGFGGVISALACQWVNHPAAIAAATPKPRQLRIAAQCGLSCLPTLITNDPDQARRFAARVGPLVYKPLSGTPETGQPVALYTTAVDPAQIDESVRHTAHLFQQAVVDKAYEVRLTIVGTDRMFPARIDAATPQARADWRADYPALTFTPVELPDPVTAGAKELLRRLDLRYGALDFIVDHHGNHHFLEINPNGQWAFIEQRAGLPITAALADDLQEGHS